MLVIEAPDVRLIDERNANRESVNGQVARLRQVEDVFMGLVQESRAVDRLEVSM